MSDVPWTCADEDDAREEDGQQDVLAAEADRGLQDVARRDAQELAQPGLVGAGDVELVHHLRDAVFAVVAVAHPADLLPTCRC